MKKVILLLTPVCLFTASAFALPDYEPFADATASGGTGYTTGSILTNQVNAQGQAWYQAGPGTGPTPTIAAGDLSVPGLYSAGGGQSAAFGGNGTSARLNLSVGAGGITNGTVYYSFATKLTDLTGLSTSGVFWAGFNNSQGAQNTTPNTVVTRLVTRSAGAGLFNVGLDKSSGTTSSFVWDSQNFTTSDTIFIVGSYTFNPNTGDDVSQLWVDPDSSTFGDASAPSALLTNSAGGDIARVASFVLYDRNANEPAGGLIDDLRFGTSWGDVTPTVGSVPEPSAISLAFMGLLTALGLRRMKRKSA